LNAVLKTDPDNGPANLGMARITAGEGTLAQVTAAYHKAIFGVWPKAREQEHQEVSLELADYLFKQGAQADAALELSGLAQRPQTPVAMKERVGRKLLAIHEPNHALPIFADVVRTNPQDGNAWAGLGEAQFESAEYQSAQESLQNAEKWGTNEDVDSHLRTAREVLSLDPSARGLTVAEKFRRSAELLRQTLALVSGCDPQAPGLAPLVAGATKQMKSNRPENTETAATNITMAEELWEANQKWCIGSASPALKLLMPTLH
jgi:tetratricopeptide (TPR) repeat protein